MTEPKFTNRLVHEKSPYLLQHAHNPVDWFPWGEEALAQAQSENKPIFLSIGYATCHWCHVMEEESFQDEELAQKMNEVFINIKVDREELPEVDALYMEFAQSMMSGAAGWPLNLVLTPTLQPFFAATYLPPSSARGLMGMRNLVERIHEVWTGEERERVIEQAAKIVTVFDESIHTSGDTLPTKSQVIQAGEAYFKMADPIYGGIKGAPKFPIGYQISFLLHLAGLDGEARALFLADRTLEMMHRGGIYDHLGGGFARYSIDEKWQVPHFEKMLYDNALLAYAYLEAWQASKKTLYETITREVLDYTLKEMTHAEGGFFSAEDADSEGEEGKYYTWSKDEIINILGEDNAVLFCQFYSVTDAGNFEDRNVLHIPQTIEEFAQARNLDAFELQETFHEQKLLLLKAREQRVRPLKDDKILSSWNGLMIFAFIEAGVALQETRYKEAAVRAARFLKTHLWKDGKLLRRWRDGEASFNAGLDEYAFLIKALLSLFEANQGTEWLEWALQLCSILDQSYKAEDGAYYQTDGGDDLLILRKVQYSDGAEPSGNAVHCQNLLRLYQLTQDKSYLQKAEDILRAVKRYIESYAPGYAYHLTNLLHYYDKKAPVFVVALNEKREWVQEIQAALGRRFLPNRAIVFSSEGETLERVLANTQSYVPIDGKTTLYLCFEGVCQSPENDLDSILQTIERA